MNRLLYEPIPSVRSVDPEVPRELDEVCAKALTRDLDKRFATAAEFSDALENAARALDWLGSHREVATCIADVLGAISPNGAPICAPGSRTRSAGAWRRLRSRAAI